jgi:hypothetical protein
MALLLVVVALWNCGISPWLMWLTFKVKRYRVTKESKEFRRSFVLLLRAARNADEARLK